MFKEKPWKLLKSNIPKSLPITKQISNISNQNELNTTWNKILKALTKAALKNIPFKKIKTIQEIKSDKPSKRHSLFYRYKQIQYFKNHPQSPNLYNLLNDYKIKYPDNLINQSQTSNNLHSLIKQEFIQIKLVLKIGRASCRERV